jgi:2-amino-4-hydroxy-6-hydroxymethyldihydropteridine diphosphokinase
LTLVYIGIGSNLGDREKNIQRSLELMGKHPKIQVLRTSTVHETEPVDMEEPDPSRFLNAAVEIGTSLSPRDLLSALKEIEGGLGRFSDPSRSFEVSDQLASGKYRSRTIDLDILLYGDSMVREEGLVIPHPRLGERRFVLEPLAELCPERVVPGLGRTVRDLRDAL